MKSIVTHVGLLLLASASAFTIWTREEKPEQDKADTVEVWSGTPDGVEAVSFEGKQRSVKIQPKKDAIGRWYVVSMDKEINAPAPKAVPDAGAPPPAPPPKHELSTFLSMKAGDELMKKLANLKALRSLGKLDAGKLVDYGLDKPEGTLKLKLGGKEQVLTIGAQTPGGSERYAKYAASGEIFAIEGDLIQSLSFADSRLTERELHSFQSDEVKRVRVAKAEKARELARVAEKKDAWADAATPSKPDESLVNWMTKVERLRATEFVEKPSQPLPANQAVVKLEYFSGNKSLGFLEVYKVTGEKGPEYLARTEFTRWYVKLVASSAEQVETDTGRVAQVTFGGRFG
ncbi:MAG: DUF4340 domain-containing protein [Polyangiaceae bacterium]